MIVLFYYCSVGVVADTSIVVLMIDHADIVVADKYCGCCGYY